MKYADQNNKSLVPRTGIRNGSEPGLRYQEIGRDPGIANYSSHLREVFEILLFRSGFRGLQMFYCVQEVGIYPRMKFLEQNFEF
jgi:hypothetical protein